MNLLENAHRSVNEHGSMSYKPSSIRKPQPISRESAGRHVLINIVFNSSAPLATIRGDLTPVEGNNLTLTCDYDDVLPAGSYSTFYVDGTVREIQKVFY